MDSRGRRCTQCRGPLCHHHQLLRRVAKLKHRVSASKVPGMHPMEPPVLSFYGNEPVPLPSRFSQVKKNLVAGHEAELEASWARLIAALRPEADRIEALGPNLIPAIDFSDIEDPIQTAQFQSELKKYGVAVVRGVMPPVDADAVVRETVTYLETKHDFKPPPPQDPTCYDFFWTPAQVKTRAHPNVLRAQSYIMGLWETDADDRLAIRLPISYADRIRIHGTHVSTGPENGSREKGDEHGGLVDPVAAAKAAEESRNLGAITSSTIIAQVDNGSLERWEPDGYGRAGVYDAVFKGNWEAYDPWDSTGRISSTPDLYNGYGACSIFRMYQGILALSTIDPGMIRLVPSPKLVTAYFLLRPFFSPKTPPPKEREFAGEAWDAYLDPSNWAIDKEQSSVIHGAVPGHAQRVTAAWHPHLHLKRLLVALPTLEKGDYIFWHPDLAYHIASTSSAPSTPSSSRPATAASESSPQPSVMVYLPAAPLTQTNALYLARQRKAFLRGHPGPDFDSTGSGLGSEAPHSGRLGEQDIADTGGAAGLQAMGLAPWDVTTTPPPASVPSSAGGSSVSIGSANGSDDEAKKDGPLEMDIDAVDRGLTTALSVSQAEAEVVRLANIILFPDRYDFYMAKKNGSSGTNTPAIPASRKES